MPPFTRLIRRTGNSCRNKKSSVEIVDRALEGAFKSERRRFRTAVCSWKPNIPPGEPVGFFDSAVVCQYLEIPLARPAVSSAYHYSIGERGPSGMPTKPALCRLLRRLSPKEEKHIQKSEVCATCHTLYTKALGPGGKEVGELDEQMPYPEWLHSDYREKESCQSCHMPAVKEPVQADKLSHPMAGRA